MHVIGGVKFGTSGGALRFAPLVVCSGEESFETGPRFLLCSETFPGFAGIDKETSLINEMEVYSNHLFDSVGIVAGGGVVTAIFDPIEKGFDRLIDIVRGAENSIVFLKIRGRDVGVGGVQMIQDGVGGGEAVSNVLVSEVADEHFINSRENNLSESLVGAILLVEECRGSVKSIAKFGDLGASGVGWDDGFRAGVDRQDEGNGQKSVVDGG